MPAASFLENFGLLNARLSLSLPEEKFKKSQKSFAFFEADRKRWLNLGFLFRKLRNNYNILLRLSLMMPLWLTYKNKWQDFCFLKNKVSWVQVHSLNGETIK